MTNFATPPAGRSSSVDNPRLAQYARILDLAHTVAPTVGLQQLIAEVHQDLRALVAAGATACTELEELVAGAIRSVVTALQVEWARLH